MDTKYQRKFKDEQFIEAMKNMRKIGFTYKQLAMIFNCDFSTIYHHCQKFEVQPVTKVTVTLNVIHILISKPYVIPKDTPETQWYIRDNGEKINKGKSYQEYLHTINHKL